MTPHDYNELFRSIDQPLPRKVVIGRAWFCPLPAPVEGPDEILGEVHGKSRALEVVRLLPPESRLQLARIGIVIAGLTETPDIEGLHELAAGRVDARLVADALDQMARTVSRRERDWRQSRQALRDFYERWFAHVRARYPFRVKSRLNRDGAIELLEPVLDERDYQQLLDVLRLYGGTGSKPLKWLAEFRRENLEEEGLSPDQLNRIQDVLTEVGLSLLG